MRSRSLIRRSRPTCPASLVASAAPPGFAANQDVPPSAQVGALVATGVTAIGGERRGAASDAAGMAAGPGGAPNGVTPAKSDPLAASGAPGDGQKAATQAAGEAPTGQQAVAGAANNATTANTSGEADSDPAVVAAPGGPAGKGGAATADLAGAGALAPPKAGAPIPNAGGAPPPPQRPQGDAVTATQHSPRPEIAGKAAADKDAAAAAKLEADAPATETFHALVYDQNPASTAHRASAAPATAAATAAQDPRGVTANTPSTPLSALPIEIGMRALAGAQSFQIRLHPEEYGRVDVKLDIDDSGAVSAQMVVDRVETLNLLQRDAKTLERAFEQAGLRTSDGGLQFSLNTNAGGQNAQQDRAGRDQGSRRAPLRQDADASLSATDITAALRSIRTGSGGLDIRI